MKLLADEGIDAAVVARLRSAGHEVTYIAELDPGIDDEQVLTLATAEAAVLLTADKDFGELVFRRRQVTAGVLLVRLPGLAPVRKAALVNLVVNRYQDQLLGAFAVIRPGSVRVRRAAS